MNTIILAVLMLLLPTTPESDLAGFVKAFLTQSQSADWESVEQLPGVRWAPLPPTALRTCLPEGDCFARQGIATIGGSTMMIIAAGARTMVNRVFIRNAERRSGRA